MKKTKKVGPKSWHTCSKCGKKFFPKVDQKKFMGITVMLGTCPDCGDKNVTLIPITDFRTYNTPYWD
jgi:predicted  nucleic acid-binding Zn-ribbon protein